MKFLRLGSGPGGLKLKRLALRCAYGFFSGHFRREEAVSSVLVADSSRGSEAGQLCRVAYLSQPEAAFAPLWRVAARDDAGLRCIARSGKLDRARSRLYRDQILQENMRLKALAEICKIHSFAQLQLSKICQQSR